MKVYLIANPKGGSGKSTLATNLAGLLAHRGAKDGSIRVMLGDADRQQSSRSWLERRPANLPAISSWEVSADKVAKPPRDTTHVIIDSPAGLYGERLKELLKISHQVLVPIQPSMFDILATQDFFNELAEMKNTRGIQVGLVGMRVDDRTKSAEQFRRFIESTGLPLITCLRNTQNYVHLAAYGLTVYDIPLYRVDKDRVQWEPIEDWV